MIDSSSPFAVGVGLGGSLIGSLLTYAGMRLTSRTAVVTTVAKLEADEAQAREERIDKQVDAFLKTQAEEIVKLKADSLASTERVDVLSERLVKAQEDIIQCKKEWADLANEVELGVLQLGLAHQRITDVTTSNKTLTARIQVLENQPRGGTS